MRESGYYWVNFVNTWFIGYWLLGNPGGCWILFDLDSRQPYFDSNFQAIDEEPVKRSIEAIIKRKT